MLRPTQTPTTTQKCLILKKMKTHIMLTLLVFLAFGAKGQFTGNPMPDFSQSHSMIDFDNYVKQVLINQETYLWQTVDLQRKITIVGNYSQRNVIMSGG